MGNGLKNADPKFQVHQKYYKTAPVVADLLFLENVPEYEMKEVVAQELGAGWGFMAQTVDPRYFGFGVSRARTYGLAWKLDTIKCDKKFPLAEVLACLKARPMMMAQHFFWRKLSPSSLTPSEVFQSHIVHSSNLWKTSFQVSNCHDILSVLRGFCSELYPNATT